MVWHTLLHYLFSRSIVSQIVHDRIWRLESYTCSPMMTSWLPGRSSQTLPAEMYQFKCCWVCCTQDVFHWMRKFQGKLHILGQRHLGHLWQMPWNLYKLTTLQRQNHKLQDCNPGAPPCNDGFAALYFPCGQSGPERRLCRQFIFSLPPEFVATFPLFFGIDALFLLIWHLRGEEQRSRFL